MSEKTPPGPADDIGDVPPTVLAMADQAVLRMHKLLDGAPLALVVNAYRAGYAYGRMEAAAAIRADMEGVTSQMRGFIREVMESAAKVADRPEPEPQPTIPTSDIPAVVRRRSRP